MDGSEIPPTGLSDGRKKILLDVAKRSIGAAVRDEPAPVFDRSDAGLLRPAGVFCTLTTGGELRGCVGFVEPVHPLLDAVSLASVKAATEDHRFTPVSRSELPLIKIELSVLGPRERVLAASAIVIGRDGLYLEAPSARGLLLPQVAVENGWDVPEFIRQVFRKCGLSPMPIDAPGIALYRFAAGVFS